MHAPVGAGETDTADPLIGRGLKRGILGFVVVLACFAGATLMGMWSLDRQVSLWAQIEDMDSRRESLLDAVQQHSAHGRAYSASVLAELDDLGRLSQSLGNGIGDDRFATAAAQSAFNARQLIRQIDEMQDAALTLRAVTYAKIGALQAETTRWAETLQTMREEIDARADQSEQRNRVLNGKQGALAKGILSAERLQRQLDAHLSTLTDRTGQNDAVELPDTDISGLSMPCADEIREDPAHLCTPSPARALNMLSNIDGTTARELASDLRRALWALDAYIRAGEAQFVTLAGDIVEAIDMSEAARAEAARQRDLEGALNRINRVLIHLGKVLQRSENPNPIGIEAIDAEVTAVIAQLRLRGTGLLRLNPELGTSPAALDHTVQTIARDWQELLTILRQRDTLASQFDKEMATLANSVSSTAESIRRATSIWVDLFASVALIAVSLLLAVLLATYWITRRQFILPLQMVTSTILALARGQYSDPVELSRRAFGFDRLGHALEGLGRAMAERHALAERNVEQRRLIERNMEKLEETTREMRWLAMHDALTGLGNRRQADEHLQMLTAQGWSKGQNFCLIDVDINSFKEINDTLGHEAGDFILRHVGRLLKRLAGEDAKTFRVGGDEFLIATRRDTTRPGARALANRTLQEIAKPVEFAGHRCRTGPSLGIAFGNEADFDAQATLVNADLALYETKRTGRNGFRFFAEELGQLSRRRKDLADRILTAIEEEAFQPFYQPQFYADGLRLRGFETLCRWHDPDHGWIPPGQFLDVADELKVVGRIDQILFRKVARDVASLKKAGLNVPRVSFNVTADRLLQVGLAEEFGAEIGPETKVAIELLESMSLDSINDALRWSIDTLKENGIAIEIDDFGSCRASIAGLIAVGPDAMKIDGSIILPLVNSTQHLRLVEAIVEIGQALNIEVVAEGVETDEHIEILQSLGCAVLQGYALAYPMTAVDLPAFLRERRERGGTLAPA